MSTIEHWLDKPTRRGSALHPEDQAYVLRAYCYRNTVENPERFKAGGKLKPITDQRWLQITSFAVRKDGRLNGAIKECWTHHNEIPEWKAEIDAWAAKNGANSITA